MMTRMVMLVLVICMLNAAHFKQSTFTLSSSVFENGEFIPKDYTPYGKDVNPPLSWSGIPEGTKSLALIVDDPDAPNGLWTHWLVKNIPTNTFYIEEDSIPGEEVVNSWGISQWKGPKPPNGTHRYFFQLYALSKETMSANSKTEFYKEVQKYKIDEAILMGKFSKPGPRDF